MTKNSFAEKTTQELLASIQAHKVIIIALAIVGGLLAAVCIYGLTTKDENSVFLPLLVVAFSCTGIIPLQISAISNMKKELISREEND